MNLTWKDAVTTLLALLVLGFYYIKVTGVYEIPYISNNYRFAIVTLALIGVTMCAFSGGNIASEQSTLITVASVLGVGAVILIISGLVTGAKITFDLLAVTIVLLWLISTFRHFITK